jgi:hypothetical protein
MNDESLERVNAFLAAVARQTEVGVVLDVTPAEVGRDLGFPDALSTARAVRALIARKRLEPALGSYRLLDARPVEASEREAIGRRPRKTRERTAPRERSGGGDQLSYSDVGRASVDRLIDLGREVGTMRAGLRQAREEARESRQARDEAERRASTLTDRVRELEARAEMADSNLRTLLASARTTETPKRAGVSDSEMEAILGVLKGGDDAAPEPGEIPGSEVPADRPGA